jgi:hypothetical protein
MAGWLLLSVGGLGTGLVGMRAPSVGAHRRQLALSNQQARRQPPQRPPTNQPPHRVASATRRRPRTSKSLAPRRCSWRTSTLGGGTRWRRRSGGRVSRGDSDMMT